MTVTEKEEGGSQHQEHGEEKMNLALQLNKKLLTNKSKGYLSHNKQVRAPFSQAKTKQDEITTEYSLEEHCALSASCSVLFKVLPHILGTGKSVLLAKFTTEVVLLLDFLQKMEISSAGFDGSTKADKRDDIVRKLSASIDALVATIEVAGEGLNLMAACFLVLFSVDYQPGIILQAHDRIVRLQQQRKPKILLMVPNTDAYQNKMRIYQDKEKVNKVVLDLFTERLVRKLPDSIVVRVTISNKVICLDLISTFDGKLICNWEGGLYTVGVGATVQLPACAYAQKV